MNAVAAERRSVTLGLPISVATALGEAKRGCPGIALSCWGKANVNGTRPEGAAA